jgi:hypothetical protein
MISAAEAELESLLEKIGDGPAAAEAFYRGLLTSPLYVITDEEGEGTRNLSAGDTLAIINFTMTDGTPYIPVFTSLPELQKTLDRPGNFFSLQGWDLFNMVRGADVVVNPASESGIHLTPDFIEQVLQHFAVTPNVVEEETQVMIGQPAHDPLELKQAVAAVFERDGSVQSAHLCLMVKPDNDRSLVIGVVFRPGQERRDVFNIAGTAASPFIPPGHALDFMIIRDADDDGVAGTLLRDGDHFFRARTQA